MSVAAFQPPTAIYREEQNFAWWLYALMALMVALLGVILLSRPSLGAGAAGGSGRWGLQVPIYLLVGLVLPPVMLVGVLHMTTEVAAGLCGVSFGWIPTFRRVIPLAQVRRVEVVRYQAILDHGFWGIRRAPDGEFAYTARGDRGVRLHLIDGSRILIGSQRPEELASVLERELRPMD